MDRCFIGGLKMLKMLDWLLIAVGLVKLAIVAIAK